MLTVNEVSKLSGVSVRTLHHYHKTGLLIPAAISEAGYRLYDGTSLDRLKQILLFRELMFPLKEIKSILDDPGYDRERSLKDQIILLKMQRSRLDGLIDLCENMLKGDTDIMDFNNFDKSEFDKYAAEAKQRWGNTEAYAEYEKRGAGKDAADGLMQKIAEAASMRPLPPEDAAVSAKVREIQKYITDNFYTCTDEIFAGLAAMYTGDPRMKANIDKTAGEGAAEYVSRAITACLAK